MLRIPRRRYNRDAAPPRRRAAAPLRQPARHLFDYASYEYLLHTYTRAQNVCPEWPVYEVKQPQEKWACDFHDDAPPLSFQLQVAEVIF